MRIGNLSLCLVLAALAPLVQSAQIELVSAASVPALTPSNGASLNARASADLRYVVFESYADNLVAGDSNRRKDILLFDRVANTRAVISRTAAEAADDDSFGADISADGNTIVFSSSATNLVAGDSNGLADLFVYTRLNGALRRLSPAVGVQPNGPSRQARISGDGTRIAFTSGAINWVVGDSNGVDDVFAFELATDAVQRVSLTDMNAEGSGRISMPSISADGRCVAFNADAPFVANDFNIGPDVFIRDLTAQGTVRVSVGFDGREAESNLYDAGFLIDCDTTMFASYDGALSGHGLGNGLFFYRRSNGWTDLAHVSLTIYGRVNYTVSRNGQFLLVGEDTAFGGSDAEIRRINLATFANLPIAGRFGIPLVVSDDGEMFIAQTERPVVLADRNVLSDLFVQGPSANPSWLSARPTGALIALVANGASGRADNADPITPGAGTRTQSITDDGNLVLFDSLASNLVSNDNNNLEDVFLRNRLTGTTTLLSVAAGGAESNGLSRANDISSDGRFVTFESCASNLIVDDSNGLCDVFLLDRQSSTIERINVSSAGVAANQQGDTTRGHWSRVSADGRFVVFMSMASNLVPEATTVQRRIYLRDRQAGTTTLIGLGRIGAITPDGRYVVHSGASGIQIWDRLTTVSEPISVGLAGAAEDMSSDWPSVSDDGRYVAFYSYSTNLVADDRNEAGDVFVRDRQTGSTALVSRPVDGASDTVGGSICEISGNGRYVAYLPTTGVNGFQPDARGLIADLYTGSIQPFVSNLDVIAGRDRVMRPRLTFDGASVVFAAFGLNRSATDITGDIPDVFVAQGAPTEVLFSGGFE
ncbi:MAG: hypothetical protein SGI99_11250 [Pseudomonadota bacterium]|nr:hypothetical protein [Pseudomonadota bacterium]